MVVIDCGAIYVVSFPIVKRSCLVAIFAYPFIFLVVVVLYCILA